MMAQVDALIHSYLAARGYACLRVDMRGTGDSEGVLHGEYLQQEQDDALEILKWIASQRWCTGSVGMIGNSWGGFNSLQVAARRPPELKAIISMCSSDDRYADDVHYMGGCLLIENFTWGAAMFGIMPGPPDPAIVGDKWYDIWMRRLEAGGNYLSEWHEHQRRDEFWRYASICEDYGAIQCPVYLVSGWMDAYTNPVFRMLEHLESPKKGLIGPWAHAYPNYAMPGPRIGFLQESIRWWDKWLKGTETGIMEEPVLRSYIQDTVPPRTTHASRPGRWVAEASVPSQGLLPQPLGLAPGRLTSSIGSSDEKISVCSPQTVGFAAGRWCPFGLNGDGPGDQRQEVGGSLVFDGEALSQPVDLLGAIVVNLRVSSNKSSAFIAAVVSEILPDGSATRLTYGVLNLTHRHGHTDIQPLEPGRFYNATLRLNDCGQRISAGSRLRLALSTSYFPIIWPSPEAATLTVDLAHSILHLPVRAESPLDTELPPFEPAENGKPLQTIKLREGSHKSTITQDLETSEVSLCIDTDSGLVEYEDNGWRFGASGKFNCGVLPDDPLSAHVEHRFRKEYGRGELTLVTEGWSRMKASLTEFHITSRLDVFKNEEHVFGRDYDYSIPRDHV
ncbi:putative hydrolase family protein [Phaeoacremonium minimum UCRPA7]|uniref:Putative hydrolase family protein n=1 Tax=Phaeoacremonium minimum (strain UCR-PA7) TaxID=1286976 RepID=R8BCH0_PHAM7|nr:putative hydrolase family protein [Phaeoacremonium minimum UCRPA7]EON96998.1 putative hydrolase family protein [Phaeoacremonium minimum UCRPA7]